jgi:hypothetical protein
MSGRLPIERHRDVRAADSRGKVRRVSLERLRANLCAVRIPVSTLFSCHTSLHHSSITGHKSLLMACNAKTAMTSAYLHVRRANAGAQMTA